jgi:hypothetical protein
VTPGGATQKEMDLLVEEINGSFGRGEGNIFLWTLNLASFPIGNEILDIKVPTLLGKGPLFSIGYRTRLEIE